MPEKFYHNNEGPQVIQESTEVKTVKIIPVEQLIPEIKPTQIEKLDGIDYQTNQFGDSFIYEFFKGSIDNILEDYIRNPENLTSDFSILKERMRGQIILDLGSNESILGYELASLLGASAYIGVDINANAVRMGNDLQEFTSTSIKTGIKNLLKFEDYSHYSESENQKRKAGKEKVINDTLGTEIIPASIVRDDLLSFLKRLPNNSVSIFTFGIDNNVIPDERYRQEVGQEIQRVLNQKGGYLTYTSNITSGKLINPFKELSKKGQANNTQLGGGVYANFFVKEINLRERGKQEESLGEIYKKLPEEIRQQLQDYANNILGFETMTTKGIENIMKKYSISNSPFKSFELSEEINKKYEENTLMQRYLKRINDLIDQVNLILAEDNPPNPEKIKKIEKEVMQAFYGIPNLEKIKI